MKAKHGFMGNKNDEGYEHARRCYIHGWHGFLYTCKYYPRFIKNKIRYLANKFRKPLKLKIIE